MPETQHNTPPANGQAPHNRTGWTAMTMDEFRAIGRLEGRMESVEVKVRRIDEIAETVTRIDERTAHLPDLTAQINCLQQSKSMLSGGWKVIGFFLTSGGVIGAGIIWILRTALEK